MALDTVTNEVYQVVVVTPTEPTPSLTFEIVQFAPLPNYDTINRWKKEGFATLKQDGYFFGPFEGNGPYQTCFYRCPNQYSIVFWDLSDKEYVYSFDTNRTPVERIDPPVDEEKLTELRSDTGCWFDEFYGLEYLRLVDPWFGFLSTGVWPERDTYSDALICWSDWENEEEKVEKQCRRMLKALDEIYPDD